MLEFKEGQTYICTSTDEDWWTEGREYKVFKGGINGELVIEDDTGIIFIDVIVNLFTRTKFKLKEETDLIDNQPHYKNQGIEPIDLIDNQPHYKNQGIEPIDLMRKNFSKEEFAGFLQGNVLKYMLRYKDKNGVEDLKKAKTYLTWLIEEEEK